MALDFGGLSWWDLRAGREDASCQPRAGGKKTQPKPKQPQNSPKRETHKKNPHPTSKNYLLVEGFGITEPQVGGAGERVTQKYIHVVENEVTAGHCHPPSAAGAGRDGSCCFPGAQPSQPQGCGHHGGFCKVQGVLGREGPSATVAFGKPCGLGTTWVSLGGFNPPSPAMPSRGAPHRPAKGNRGLWGVPMGSPGVLLQLRGGNPAAWRGFTLPHPRVMAGSGEGTPTPGPARLCPGHSGLCLPPSLRWKEPGKESPCHPLAPAPKGASQGLPRAPRGAAHLPTPQLPPDCPPPQPKSSACAQRIETLH